MFRSKTFVTNKPAEIDTAIREIVEQGYSPMCPLTISPATNLSGGYVWVVICWFDIAPAPMPKQPAPIAAEPEPARMVPMPMEAPPECDSPAEEYQSPKPPAERPGNLKP